MASVIFRNLSQPQAQSQQTQQQPPQGNNPIGGMVNNLVGQVMNSINPQAAFNELVSKNPSLMNGMNIINQYGNGDPKAAFFNYAQSAGKSALAQQILSNLGLQ